MNMENNARNEQTTKGLVLNMKITKKLQNQTSMITIEMREMGNS